MSNIPISTVNSKIISDTALAYTAGLFDGEGSVSILFSTTRKDGLRFLALVVQLTGKAKKTLTWLQDAFGGHLYKEVHKNRATMYYKWMILGAYASTFLATILPYLKTKKTHAKIAIEFQMLKCPKTGSSGKLYRYERQLSLKNRITILNRRGGTR